MRRRRWGWDDVTIEEVASSISSPFVRRLWAFIGENQKACGQAAWRKSSAHEIFTEAELQGIGNWDNATKIEVLIGCAQAAAEAKKIADRVDKALTLFTYTDCLARHLMGVGIRLDDQSAAALIEAYGRRMRGHRRFPFFGTRHSTREEEERDRRAFGITIRPHLRPAGLLGGGRALASFRRAVWDALPLPDADYHAFSSLVGPDEKAKWDGRIAELARRQADAKDINKLDREEVLARAKEAIADFAAGHTDETFYAFALDATMLCLDSVERHAALVKDFDLRRTLRDNPTRPPLRADEMNPGDFEYQGFVDLGDEFPALRIAYEDYYESKLRRKNGRFYAEFAQWLIERLVADNAFGGLRGTTPFHVTWSKDND